MVEAAPFQVVAEAIGDAIVIADGDSRVVWCNRGAAALFGWAARDAVGRPLTGLMPERYRDAHLQGMARLLAGGEARLIGRGPVEIEALGPEGQEIPVELTLSRWNTEAGETRFVAVLRDVRARRQMEREREAQLAVARALASSSTTARAAGEVIQALAGVMRWELGAVWLLDDDADRLCCVQLWAEDETATATFCEATRSMTFLRGVGLPGLVWARRRPLWLRDATKDDDFQRVAAAAEAGLHGAVAMPIIDGERVVGVLEFFSSRLASPDEAFETILESAGEQFVQFFRRKHAEDELAAAEAELDAQRFAQRQSAEINDNIIHWLVQITQSLEVGDQRAAERATHQALQHASRIITDLQMLPQPARP